MTLAGIVFPVAKSWISGDGWLERLGYIDSTSAVCVYIIGGVSGYVGTLMLGGRLAVYKGYKDGIESRIKFLKNSSA